MKSFVSRCLRTRRGRVTSAIVMVASVLLLLFPPGGPIASHAETPPLRIPGIGLHAFLAPWERRLERFGGHAQAIGMTVALPLLAGLRQEWEAAAASFDPALLAPRFEYELALEPRAVDRALLAELGRLEPCGQ